MLQTLSQSPNHRVVMGCNQATHVERAAHFSSTTRNESLAPPLAAVMVKGSQTDQAGDLATVQLSQLWQMGHQNARQFGTDTRDALQQLVPFAPQGRFGDEMANLSVDLLNLFIQPSQMNLQIVTNCGRTSSSQAIRLCGPDL